MIRRQFVNVIACHSKTEMCSLHRLDVSKHLFYPSTADAEAANSKAPAIERLPGLPAPTMNLQSSPTKKGGARQLLLFALGGSEGRILCSDEAGHTLLYDADAHCSHTMPAHRAGDMERDPVAISVARPGQEDDLYVMNRSAYELERFTSFDVLSFGGEGRRGIWHWDSLPPLPESALLYRIGSHAVVDGGRTICVSGLRRGGSSTYCFDTVEREWRKAGDFALPFAGGAEYVPDLKLWLGFSDSCIRLEHLCAADLSGAMDKPPTLQRVWQDVVPVRVTPKRSFKLVNLGEGRFFCIAKLYHYTSWEWKGARPRYYFSDSDMDVTDKVDPEEVVLTGVEAVTTGGGLRMVRHKSISCVFRDYQMIRAVL
ncbi:hypothetical protein ACP70R_014673 [Stipagrostis hirtigluma subsp. patula]